MKKIETKDAVGHVICHDITIIVKDQIKDTAFRKGHIVREEEYSQTVIYWKRPSLCVGERRGNAARE